MLTLSGQTYRQILEKARQAEQAGKERIAIQNYERCVQIRPNKTLHRRLMFLYEKRGNSLKSMHHQVQSVILEMPFWRGLYFKKKVKMGTKNKIQLYRFLKTEFDHEFSTSKIQSILAMYTAFGFISKPLNLKKILLKLMSQEVAGFYNPKSKKLYLIKKPRKRGLLEILTGRRDDSEERMIIAHELTHYLQDQYFDLLKLEQKTKKNDDRYLAFQALVEGDATLLMFEYLMKRRLLPESAKILRFTFSLQKKLLPWLGGKELRNTPRIMREGLFFPYLDGFFFCLEVRDGESWEPVNRVYRRLPSSTEHILHPKKYIAGIDMPYDFKINSQKLLGKKWQVISNNVLGEFGCRVLFEHFHLSSPSKIAAGWGGDRYIIAKNELGEPILIWLTVWDSQKDAIEFFQAYQEIMNRKFLGFQVKNVKNEIIYKNKKYFARISLDGKVVRVVEKAPNTLHKHLWTHLKGLKPSLCKK